MTFMGPSIAIATCAEFPRLPESERGLLGALADVGVRAEPAVWDDPAVDWSRFGGVVIRSTWDYHRKAAAFRAWLDRLEALKARVWNPIPLLRWNLDKHYLADLRLKGVGIVPTEWVEAGDPRRLDDVLSARGWTEAVVKPAVSATAFRTHRVRRDGPRAQAALDEVLSHSAAMVQPFLREIVEEGEWALVFLGGEYSHAVLKTPATGDFRVQEEHGGAYKACAPSSALIEQARAILAAAGGPFLYARVDGVRRGGDLILLELELVEPELFLSSSGQAPQKLARAISDRLHAIA